MKLDSKKTEALLAIIDTGSFEQAAKQLNITGSAISQRIKALETQLGVPLVSRTRPCYSTQEGLALVHYLRRSQALEQEFESDFYHSAGMKIPIAINNDSLGTWFLPALTDFLQSENILLDILVNDQDFTHTALEAGTALAAISAKSTAMKGCNAVLLGSIRYRLLASPSFYARYFKHGLNRNSIVKAPLLVFDRKDQLQANFLHEHFSVHQDSCSVHYIPSTEAFYHAIKLGIAYGMVPSIHCAKELASGEIIDLVPGCYIDTPLYWHHWDIQSPKLAQLTQCLIEQSKRWLF